MTLTREKDVFFTTLAAITFLADLWTLAQFIKNQSFLSFWTFTWLITIAFIILLAVGGFVFLVMSGNEEIAYLLLVFYGAGYTLVSLMLYLFFGYRQIHEKNAIGDFFGFLTLLAVVCMGAFFCILYSKGTRLRFSSYGYATVNLLYMFLMIDKYVLQRVSFAFWQFTGETTILVIGAALFLATFSIAERSMDLEISG